MKSSDFGPSSPGWLVKLDDTVAAFVPAPIPDELPLDAAATRLLGDAEHALGRLAGTAARLVNPFLIGSPLLHREAILSSRIEGTITSPEQLALIEAGAPESDDVGLREDTEEVRNYIRAMEHGLASPLPLSLRLLRDLHRVLLSGVRGNRERPGEFRNTQNYIGHSQASIALARFVPPPVREMNECLQQLERMLNRDREPLPLLVKIAAVHYQFEAIHPFRDGNGRIGRLLIPLMLVRSGRMPQPVLYLSAYLERNRERYMDLLLEVSKAGAWLDWMTFFLEGVRQSAEESLSQADAILALRDEYHERMRGSRAFGQLQKLIDELFRSPSTTIALTASRLDVSAATASGHIKRLVTAGVLREWTGRKRDQVFIAPGILEFMEGPEQ